MTTAQTQTWPDLAVGLYDRLTGRNAQITYDFENFRVQVPGGTGRGADSAEWVLTGTLNIRTQNGSPDPR